MSSIHRLHPLISIDCSDYYFFTLGSKASRGLKTKVESVAGMAIGIGLGNQCKQPVQGMAIPALLLIIIYPW